jgi:nitrogen fixation/metabolism regulation signal transduction histidine kinase
MRLLVSNLIESLETRGNEAATSLNADAQSTVRTVILAMVLTGLLGLGLAVLLTRRITQPVRALVCAAQNLSKGKLGQRVEIRGRDELARLGRAFNHMASSLQLQNYALLNEQSKLRSVHQSITDGILVFGNNGFIISANPAAEATIKKEEAMLAGSRTTGIMELDEILNRPELIGPDDACHIIDSATGLAISAGRPSFLARQAVGPYRSVQHQAWRLLRTRTDGAVRRHLQSGRRGDRQRRDV